jgi:hypothetical protein
MVKIAMKRMATRRRGIVKAGMGVVRVIGSLFLPGYREVLLQLSLELEKLSKHIQLLV